MRRFPFNAAEFGTVHVRSIEALPGALPLPLRHTGYQGTFALGMLQKMLVTG